MLSLRRSLGLLVLVPLLPTSLVLSDEAQELQRVIDTAWEFRLAESPLWATAVGDHRANDRLDSVTPEEIDRRASRLAEFIMRLDSIDATALPADKRVDRAILRRLLADDVSEHRFKAYLMPINSREGFHVSFAELGNRVPLATTADYENYIARLIDFGRYADEHIALLREGIRTGRTMPSVIMEGTELAFESQIVESPRTSRFFTHFRKFPSSVPETEHKRLQDAAAEAIRTSVVPAYRRLLTFMKEEYLPNCRATIAARDLPDGADYYQSCVRKYTTLDDATPEQIHRIGLEEVARIRGEMEEILKQVEFDGSLAEFIAMLRTDPKFYAKSKEEYLKECALILKRIDGELPRLFTRHPRLPYGLKEIPAYIAPKTTAAYYQPPPGDGTQAGYYFLNTYDLPSRPLYLLEALSMHEAVPGHHFQIALQQELENLPEFRKHDGFTVFVEGWALYAERLGLEIGFYEDPISDFGRLSMEIWRACRLVVDTGIHRLGWSRQQAIDFMSENTALSLHDIRSEVDRYIGWPGQALAYKMGEIKIRELRARAETELGDRFDLRQFHDMLLASGAVPLDVLEANVVSWIDSRKK